MFVRGFYYVVDEKDYKKYVVKNTELTWRKIIYEFNGIPLRIDAEPTDFPIYLEKKFVGWDDEPVFYPCSKEKILEHWNNLLTEIQNEIKEIENRG